MQFLISFLTFYVLISFCTGQETCNNYYSQRGTCIPITSCPSLNQINQNPNKSFWDRLVINGNVCGTGSPRKVCCTDATDGLADRAPFGSVVQPVMNPTISVTTTTVAPRTQEVSSSILPIPGSNKCGTHFPDRVHGGDVAGIDEHPWMAQLETTWFNGEKEMRCAGALINSRYVLTAAHCLPKEDDGFNITGVRLGEWNTSTRTDCFRGTCADPVQDIVVEEIIGHPDYVPGSKDYYHDIALLRLATPAKFSVYVKPICLPTTQELQNINDFDGKSFDISGWGATEQADESDIKLRVTLTGVSLDTCNWIWREKKNPITDKQMCAGGDRGKDSCQGDSGGPLMLKHKDKAGNNFLYAAGVVSYGLGCGLRNWPGVYTNVAKYMDWINENVKP